MRQDSQLQTALSFSRAARTYDMWAAAQQTAAARLVALLPEEFRPDAILDAGCGTGLLTRSLAARYPAARIIGIDIAPGMIAFCREHFGGNADFIVADATTYVADQRFGLVASSCAFQWFGASIVAIRHLAGFLVSGGLMACALPVKGSFPELQASLLSAGIDWRPALTLPEPGELPGLMEQAGLTVRRTWTEDITTLYPDAWRALRSFTRIGASLQGHPGYRPLPGHAVRMLLSAYEHDFSREDGAVPLTYKITFTIAEKLP